MSQGLAAWCAFVSEAPSHTKNKRSFIQRHQCCVFVYVTPMPLSFWPSPLMLFTSSPIAFKNKKTLGCDRCAFAFLWAVPLWPFYFIILFYSSFASWYYLRSWHAVSKHFDLFSIGNRDLPPCCASYDASSLFWKGSDDIDDKASASIASGNLRPAVYLPTDCFTFHILTVRMHSSCMLNLELQGHRYIYIYHARTDSRVSYAEDNCKRRLSRSRYCLKLDVALPLAT